MARAPRICSQPGCPDPVTERGRCDAHQPEAWAGSDRGATLPRNWATIRRHILQRDLWRCQLRDRGCTLRATEVDHIGDRDNHDPTNLRAVCHPCHARRSAKQGVAARKGVGGAP